MLDSFVKPNEQVLDYRKHVTGITPEDLRDAASEAKVRAEVAAIIKDRVIIGHALHNDLTAMSLKHPRKMIRDTSLYLPLRLAPHSEPKLKDLAGHWLGREIQTGVHDPREDALAALDLYKLVARQWEKDVRKGKSMGELRAEVVKSGEGRGPGVKRSSGGDAQAAARGSVAALVNSKKKRRNLFL